MKARFIIFLLLLICSSIITAQQPSHYILGEEELVGVDIYSITQSNTGVIWLTTDDGILKYDGYKFQNIKSTSAKSNSLFGLTKDNNGDLFCCNLNGQIFKVKNDSLHLFYEIPDSLLSNLVHFNFDNNNQLVFCTNGYYMVDKHSQANFLYFSNQKANYIAKSKQDELIFIDQKKQQIAYYKDNKILTQKVGELNADYPKTTKNNLYFIKTLTTNVYSHNSSGWAKINFEQDEKLTLFDYDFYPINDSLLCFVNRKNGLIFYDHNGKLKFNKTKLFPRHRISCFLTDKEGSLWLPTLGKGIIIIPNANIVDYNNHPLLKEDDLKAITSDKDGNIYTAGLNGVIYKIKHQQVEVLKNHNTKIEFLKYYPHDNFLFFNSTVFLLAKSKELGINNPFAKDVSIIDSTHFFIASNQGIYSSFLDNKNNLVTSKFISKHRTSCITYDTIRNEIWAGTTKGLQFISDNENKFVLFNNQHFFATDIEYIKGEIWVSTTKNGILIYKNGLFSRVFEATPYKKINELTYTKNKLYFTSEHGLHIYNFKTQSTVNISKTDGLISNKIIDFEVVNDTIWLVLPNGLQCINQNILLKNTPPPTITWSDILVNNKSYNDLNTNEFNYKQNQFEFIFISSTFRHQGTLTYQHQLTGLNDTIWQETSYKNNIVKYSSLPYGNYIFKVKAINENGIESSPLSYSFNINPPYWLTWWFFTLCGLILILAVTSYFIIRLRIIRKRLLLEKQLKTSEITAIKAQMNPHFMFNALNSIQDLIMLKDVRSSNVYLGKFADLMRKTLEFSSKNYIALTQEIEILELYLELEKLRFGDDFITTINCEISDDKLQELQIPSMLLQPYVENAIKHGLLHKKGTKELTINFYLKRFSLVCEIIDKGVGRNKSAEIKNRREKYYPSFSSEANEKRIDLIRESTNKNITLNIIDLYKDDYPTGTKVVFEFE